MFKKTIRVSLWFIVISFIVITAAGLVLWHREDMSFFSIHSDKLDHSVRTGDLVIAKHVHITGAAVPYDEIKNKIVTVIPLAGYIFDLMRQPISMIALIYLPALLIVTAELKKIIRSGYRPYKIARYL